MRSPPTSRGRGRPAVLPEERKRNNITLAVRDALKDALEARAEKNQHSLSQEMADLIQLVVIEYAGVFEDPRTAKVFASMAEICRFTQMPEVPGPHWLDNRAKFDFVKQRWDALLEQLQPPATQSIDYLRLHFESQIVKISRLLVEDGNSFAAETCGMEIGLYPPSELRDEYLQRAADLIGCSVERLKARDAAVAGGNTTPGNRNRQTKE